MSSCPRTARGRSTAGDGGAVLVWDIDPATGRWSQREALTGHDGDVVDVAVDPAGRRLFTMSRDHTLITWDMTADGGFGTAYPALRGALDLQPAAAGRARRSARRADPAGHAAVVRDNRRTRTRRPLPRRSSIPPPATVVTRWSSATRWRAPFGSSVAVSPDGSQVAVTWGLGTTVLDTGTRAVITEIVLPPDGTPAPRMSRSRPRCGARPGHRTARGCSSVPRRSPWTLGTGATAAPDLAEGYLARWTPPPGRSTTDPARRRRPVDRHQPGRPALALASATAPRS